MLQMYISYIQYAVQQWDIQNKIQQCTQVWVFEYSTELYGSMVASAQVLQTLHKEVDAHTPNTQIQHNIRLQIL